MEINHMEYLSLSGVQRLWNNIKTYINKEFNIFKSGSAGQILTSDGNGGIEWKTQAIATLSSAGLMSPDDKSKLENQPQAFEILLNGNDYDTIINADGLVNSGDLLTTCNFTKAEYKNIANDIKFIRISNNDNTRSTLFNVSFCMPEYSIICGYCFNKLNDTQMGVGYVTIRYDGSGKNLKIAAIRSTMPIDGTGDDFNTLVESVSQINTEANRNYLDSVNGSYTNILTDNITLSTPKAMCYLTVRNNCTITLNPSSYYDGANKYIILYNDTDTDYAITLSGCICVDGNSTVTVNANEYAEISIIKINNNLFVRSIGG